MTESIIGISILKELIVNAIAMLPFIARVKVKKPVICTNHVNDAKSIIPLL